MAASGILGEYKGSQAREVIITLDEYERIRSQMEADTEAGYEDLAETDESSEPAYVSEGQQEYLATDSDDEDDWNDISKSRLNLSIYNFTGFWIVMLNEVKHLGFEQDLR